MTPVLLDSLAVISGSSVPSGDFTESVWRAALFYIFLVAAGLAIDVALMFRWARTPMGWRDRAARIKWRPWSRTEAYRLVILLMGLYLVVNIIHTVLGTPEEEPGVGWVVLQSLFFHIAGLGFIAAALKRQNLTWREVFGFRVRPVSKDLSLGVMFYLGILPILVFYTAVYHTGLQFAGYEPMPQEVVMVFAGEPSWIARAYMVFLAAVIAPLFEELLFRGVALPLVARRLGVAPAVVLISAFFAIVHFHTASLVPLFLIAVGFSLAYIYSGSLLVPIVMHSLFNTVNLVLLMMLKGAIQ